MAPKRDKLMDPKLAGFWRVVTNTYNAVGLLYTIITGVYSAVADVLAWLFLPSATLALYCTFGILIGSLAGFFLLPLKWEAKPKDEQVRAIKWHFTAALIAFAVFVLYVQSLSASFAESNVIIEFIREAFL